MAADPSGSISRPAEDVPRPARRRRGSVGVAVVAAMAGLLFVTNAAIFSDDDTVRPGSLRELARAENQRLETSVADVAELRDQISTLLAQQALDDVPLNDPLETLEAARTDVTGPGLVVSLSDAPPPVNIAGDNGFHPDDLVVHQQDLEAVMNALWAGGAEAMMVQDQRITATSAVRCVGNVLLLHGRQYSPPYRISAIGDPARLQAALEASPGVRAYLQYVDSVGLGWDVNHPEQIEMPAYSGRSRMDHARVPVAYAGADDETRSDDGDD